MSKTNTLFSYFTKSPKVGQSSSPTVKTPENVVASKDSGACKPKSVAKTKSSKAASSHVNGVDVLSKLKHSTRDDNTSRDYLFNVGDVAWAKLDGYPFWPSLVCNHPTQQKHYQGGKTPKVHVQFFDSPPSRAWIGEKSMKKFSGSGDGIRQSDAKWKNAVNDATKAMKLPVDERLKLVVCHDESDSDNGRVDEVDMTDEEEDDNFLKRVGKDGKSSFKRKGMSPEGGRKRARIIITSDSEESGDEYKPAKGEIDAADSDSASSGVEEEISEDEENDVQSDSETPVKKRKTGKSGLKRGRGKAVTSPKVATKNFGLFNGDSSKGGSPQTPTSQVSSSTKLKLAMFASPETIGENSATANEDIGKVWAHLTFDFLKDGNRRDAKDRLPSHPDFDPKTIKVPESFKSKLTPGLKQWWDIKCLHFDTVLFFKVGKFYELYHMDAVIGVKELGLTFMKGDFAHSGFPEIAFGRYSASLIERGYRVARIEQTETPIMMEERCKTSGKTTKYDKVVRREICQITTRGTRRFGFQDVQTQESSPAYLLAVAEKFSDSTVGEESTYGVCFVDTSIGKFHMGQFTDDRHGSRFRTLLAHYTPVQVLHERRGLSARTLQTIKTSLSDALVDDLPSKTAFWEADKTLRFLAEGHYFRDEEEIESQGNTNWPDVIRNMLDDSDSLGLKAKKSWELAVRALGACTCYLKRCLIEQELLSMRNFTLYIPVDELRAGDVSKIPETNYFNGRQQMILDAATIRNLDVLRNSATGTTEGTLLAKLDRCKTLSGKRLLHRWICAPLCTPSAINERLDAVGDLMENSGYVEEVGKLLAKMPDLERLLSKIHARGSAVRSKHHPDSRAIFYSDDVYSKRQIVDFVNTLNGFKNAVNIVEKSKNAGKDVEQGDSSIFRSKLLRRCTSVGSDAEHRFPNIVKQLTYFENAFDQETSKKDGKIIPNPGVDPEYDESIAEIESIENKLEAYRVSQAKKFQCKVTYFGSARNRYQLEIPERVAKEAGNEYEMSSRKAGFKRFYTPKIKELLAQLFRTEDRRDAALRDGMRRIFESFSKEYDKWDTAVQCMAVLDVLISISEYSHAGGEQMCRPEVVPLSSSVTPFLEIRDGRHPCITNVFGGGQFIPNSTVIGTLNEGGGDGDGSSARIVIVTGPNMGGKSTLMRQVGLIVILAQMGCYVPAEVCRLTPVDRVFTRLGASDNIMTGESTFYVELSETSAILLHASEHSLVLMDELGRGTSTYDGVAIAHAVVREFVTDIRCRTLFSTHYHSLVSGFADNPACSLGHMSCHVENENEEDPTVENITFLYTFAPGACPKSYGFNAAKLAGIPEDVIRCGYKKAIELENITENAKVFRRLHNNIDNISNDKLSELLAHAKI